MKTTTVETYTATIYIAGNYDVARAVCRDYCDEIGLCVHVYATEYIYTGGEEAGVAVGLINYPRFEASQAKIFRTAVTLAQLLMDRLFQTSASVVACDKTIWLSRRDD